ncbi:MAG TPA: methyltransferase domain-containing protein [Burkholderiales bacterium]|nr:methyltransferase domain-containing protein [Burkholderiales bacterium]
MDAWRKEWLSDKEGRAYGELFFRRATGALPEMESSKAAAARASRLLGGSGGRLVDVGCGAGHYYRSLRRVVRGPLQYVGIDATPQYVGLARDAYRGVADVSFLEGDIFALPLQDRYADLVMCNNVLLHLPSIAQPVRELVRISAHKLLVRTLVAEKSYVVKDVAPHPDGDEFDAQGEPRAFHFLSIYSEKYLERLFRTSHRVRSIQFEKDVEFDERRVADTGELLKHAWDRTEVTNGVQRSGMILLPWTWITVELESGR